MATRFAPGSVIAGRYRLGEQLGKGGFGTVFRAYHLDLGSDVALKVLNPEVANNDEAQQRFLKEVRATTSFVHKYAVQLREFGRDPEHACLYFTMDLIEGPTLKDILVQDGPLAPARAVQLGTQVLDVLEEAHDAGFVHRDLKPQNLIITRGRSGVEEVRVLDFGIAKAISSAQGDNTDGLTLTGSTIGTLLYMSPEQAEGVKVDARSDLYSLGAVLFEALSGQRPVGPTPGAENPRASLLSNLLIRPPAQLATAAPNVPPALQAVVMRCLEKRPADRYPSASALRRALQEALRGVSPAAAGQPIGSPVGSGATASFGHTADSGSGTTASPTGTAASGAPGDAQQRTGESPFSSTTGLFTDQTVKKVEEVLTGWKFFAALGAVGVFLLGCCVVTGWIAYLSWR